jgi:hypothetical protein
MPDVTGILSPLLSTPWSYICPRPIAPPLGMPGVPSPSLHRQCRSSAKRMGTGGCPPAIEPGRHHHPVNNQGCWGGRRRPRHVHQDNNNNNHWDGTKHARTMEMEWALNHKSPPPTVKAQPSPVASSAAVVSSTMSYIRCWW